MSLTEHKPAAPAVSSRPPNSPDEANPGASPPPLVFVGGTGRSGTHVVAQLLGRHSHYSEVPIECRFHVNPRGFPDLLSGRVTQEQFLRKLRRFWWYRVRAGEPLPALLPRLPLGRETRGLHKLIPRQRFLRAIEAFELAYPEQPETACRTMLLDLLWPLAEQQGKPGLVEMSTFTISQAPTLLRLFPEAKLIHSVRDGRDAGTSKVGKRQKRDHPRDSRQGIEWWAARLGQAEAGLAAIPRERVHTVSLDELVQLDRERSRRGILDFLGIEDEPLMREFFERDVNAEKAHTGRWRLGLSESGRHELAVQYERVLRRLEEEGFSSAPLLRRVYERTG
jgi:Sulfotransferase family